MHPSPSRVCDCFTHNRHTLAPAPSGLDYFLSHRILSEKIIMKSWFICILSVLLAVTCEGQRRQNQPNRYENFNTDSIIQNERILLAYYKCVMDKGPCTKDGKNFKRVLPETLTTACSRCSLKQKIVVRQLLLGIRAKSEPRFVELLEKYDPERVNRDALYTFLLTGN